MLILTVVVIRVPGVPGEAIFLTAQGKRGGEPPPRGESRRGCWAGAWGCLAVPAGRGTRNERGELLSPGASDQLSEKPRPGKVV